MKKLIPLVVIAVFSPSLVAGPPPIDVGVARVDITPTYPIRLSGFGFRQTESEGVTQPISAKALAIGRDDPAILIAVDACIWPRALTAELAQRLNKKSGIKPERLAITVTHSHTAP